jgi:hypothetical protein
VTEQINFSGEWDIPNPQNYDLKVSDKIFGKCGKIQIVEVNNDKKLHS